MTGNEQIHSVCDGFRSALIAAEQFACSYYGLGQPGHRNILISALLLYAPECFGLLDALFLHQDAFCLLDKLSSLEGPFEVADFMLQGPELFEPRPGKRYGRQKIVLRNRLYEIARYAGGIGLLNEV